VRKNILSVLFLCFVLTAAVQAAPDKSALLSMLQKHRFQELEKELAQQHEALVHRRIKERELFVAYSVFNNSDPALESDLDLWNDQTRNSAPARLALGIYHFHLGWLSRGSRWAKDTTSGQFAKMHAHFRVAKEALLQVISMEPDNPVAYTYLLHLLNADGSKQALERYYEQAVKDNPLSVGVRKAYLTSLEPKWGGSLSAIESFLKANENLEHKEADFKQLRDYPDYVKGDMLLHGGGEHACEEALSYFDRAVARHDTPAYRIGRAKAYVCLKNYRRAADDYSHLLSLYPDDGQYLDARGRAYYKLGDYPSALKDLDGAVRFDRMDPDALLHRAQVYYATKAMDEAYRDLSDALTYGYRKSAVHLYLGYIDYYDRKNYRSAAEELQKAIDLGHKGSFACYLTAAAQWHERDCRFVQNAHRYAQRCKAANDCREKELDWALKSANYAVDRGICK